MTVNIVMLTKDRFALRNQTLDTLQRNTKKELFNLTIVDDESSIPVSQDYRTSYDNITVLRVYKSKSVTAMVRNLGVYWSQQYWGRGDFLYLCDNDIYFTPNWLKKLVTAFEYGEQHGLRMLGGWNHPYHGANEIAKMAVGEIHTNHALAGPSQLMRWDTWDKYGPLQHGAPGVCQGEDMTFSTAITNDGFKIGKIYPHVLFSVGVTNSHGKPAPGADVMLKELVQAKKIYPDLYWE